MAGGVCRGGVLIDTADEGVDLGEEGLADVKFFNCTVLLVVLRDIPHEVVVHLGHGVGRGDGAEECNCESSHIFDI